MTSSASSHNGETACHGLDEPATERPQAVLASGRLLSQDDRPILITGGAGFIGTNVAAALAEQGCRVLVFDNLSRPGVEHNLSWLQTTYGKRIRHVCGDVRDADDVAAAVAQCRAVFHFAAQVAVTTSLEDPKLDFETNALGTFHVLEACRRQQTPPPPLFTSTNKVYGDLGGIAVRADGDRYLPSSEQLRRYGVSERQPLEFHSPYGCSKGTADQYVIDYARCWKVPAAVFRMSCIYGPHQCGTEDQGWVAHFVRQMLSGEPITFYGDGRQVRDILYVTDLVEAMLRCVNQMNQMRGKVFNVGGGPANAVSLRQVVHWLRQVSQTPAEIHFGPLRQGDQLYYVSDIRAIQQSLNWQPKVGAEEGLRRLFNWMQQHRRLPAAAV